MLGRALQLTFVGCLLCVGAAEAGPIGIMDSFASNSLGKVTYGTTIVSYDPLTSTGSPAGDWANADNALGSPDYADRKHFVSLGLGGSIVIGFEPGALTGSGTAAPDLLVSEVGPDREDTFGWVSGDGTNWLSIGRVGGGATAIDLDALGFGVNDSFSFLRLMDDPNQGLRDGLTVGADIDSVAAVNSNPVPEPGALILLSSGLVGLVARRKLRAK